MLLSSLSHSHAYLPERIGGGLVLAAEVHGWEESLLSFYRFLHHLRISHEGLLLMLAKAVSNLKVMLAAFALHSCPYPV